MNSSATYYPELDDAEFDEVIAPLARFDEQIVGPLRAHETDAASETPSDGTRATVEEWIGRPEEYPFQRIVKGVAAAVARADPVGPFRELFGDPRVILEQLLERTEARLREVYIRPLVVAVNHARRGGLLRGADPAERYAYFVEQAGRGRLEDWTGLEFPVLRAVTRTLLRTEADSFRELCGRLRADREAIGSTFGIDPTDVIVSCGFSAGDTHHHGRSVCLLAFGSGRRLAYKPRDVSCEAAYAVLVDALNDRLGTSLVAARVLDRDGYGYVAYVEAADVSDRAAEFMYESGELAAVMYLLNARDMHLENIVATRRGPVPIDLETILHPERNHVGPTAQIRGNAHETIGQSVYGIGILPLVLSGKGEDGGHVDLGFLGDQGRGDMPLKTMRFEDAFTDRVRLSLETQAVGERPTVVGDLSERETHALGERMASGFTRVCRAVMADREGWNDLLHRTMSGVRIRYIHNPTMLYGQLLRMASGAGAMDDESAYLAVLKRIAIPSTTSAPEIVRSELRQLAERDVPYFIVAATDVILRDGDGAAVVAAFPEPPIDLARAKATNLTEFVLSEQLRLVHSAFSCRFPDNHLAAADNDPDEGWPHTASARRSPGYSGDALASLVTRLCDHLVATAMPDRFDDLPPTWIGPLASARADRPWPPGVLGFDLYTGRVGPALALAAAGRALDNPNHRDLATRVFSATADLLAGDTYDVRAVRQAGLSAYTGLPGTLFALAAAGRILGRDEWTTVAQRAVPAVLDHVRDQSPAEASLDVIGGLAGVLSCVAAIGGPDRDASITTVACALAEALPGDDGHRPVLDQSGCGHGVGGVVEALSRAYPRVAPDRRHVVEAALSRLIDRLRVFHDPKEDDWFSNVATPSTFSTGWCHGAAGIALALSAYHTVSGDDSVARLRDTAVATMKRRGFGRNLTWCHGDLGNHDILSTLAAGDASLRDDVARIERTWLRPDVVVRKIEDRTSRYAHTNSLMVGSAGIVVHLVNRLDRGMRISPITVTVEGR
ncbi:type 2 lanthipeptide synthetase LanM family protein [Embleya hyalina]|uniref:Lanthionine synthetase n=1 Tax=Embleya hyalina TaxID=516124 RepID=A0A401YR36_9ACTN|nr:type 2 lanthipeptide synthetase LanM family protein [Embleya hyalina]GCD97070.1 lanthionine synthetase [Embleya hyalina]